MTRSATLRSLAKINLDLRVLHKNPDGFHELRTVFQTISLADTIAIDYTPARRTQLSLDDPLAIPDNLILRAASAVLDAMGTHAKVSFRLKKKIPMGGGLGGGSSNAAAVLLALPILAGKSLPLEKRLELGATLGSDVPFFLLGGTALGLGRGTELYPLADIAEEPMVVVAPGIHVSTPGAYKALGRGLTFIETSSKINSFQAFVRTLAQSRSAREASAFSANDFEAVVLTGYPPLKTIQGKLRKFSAAHRMSGSGSAFFSIFASKREREMEVRKWTKVGGERVFEESLVSGASYRKIWRKQLAEHLAPGMKDLWPLQSRYER
jgi:4-diphosphocytidyl-2-C-methyl-D-erythritol kinase